MPGQSPSRFVAGLVAEVAGIAVVITLLPKVSTMGMKPLASKPMPIADERPSLVERSFDQPRFGSGDAFRGSPVRLRPPESAATTMSLPANSAAVEERLDRAGQQLLEGVSSYFRKTMRELNAQPVEPSIDARPRAFSSRFPHDGF